MKIELTVPEYETGKRIDKFLSENIEGYSRSFISGLIDDGNVCVNAKSVSKSFKLSAGQLIEIEFDEPAEPLAEAEDIPLDIVYEDEHLLVVNKPKGMVVHPAAGNYTGTLVNGLLYHCKGNLSGINGVLRPGIVHRIDKNTSGLLVVAKSDIAHNSLSEQLKEHSITREYHAVVYGHLKSENGTVDAPLGRHSIDRKKMCVTDKTSKSAVTHYEVMEEFRDFTYIKCILETGRTHQIRVHMAYIGHPLAGDDVYGPKKVITELEGQCLHAAKLGFIHPVSGEYMEFKSPLPEVFEKFLQKQRNIS